MKISVPRSQHQVVNPRIIFGKDLHNLGSSLRISHFKFMVLPATSSNDFEIRASEETKGPG
jgi:hypothetical protein